MSLRDRNGERPDSWYRTETPAGDGASLVPFARLEEALAVAGNRTLGVEIGNTVKPEALLPHLDRLALVAIAFPSFADGRGFSLARALRNAGYAGTLRAVGPLIADQFAYALACGFDEVELPEAVAARQPVSQWLAALGAMRFGYQTNLPGGGQSILERRRAARKAAP